MSLAPSFPITMLFLGCPRALLLGGLSALQQNPSVLLGIM